MVNEWLCFYNHEDDTQRIMGIQMALENLVPDSTINPVLTAGLLGFNTSYIPLLYYNLY